MAYEIVLKGKIADEDLLTVLHYELTEGTEPDWNDVATIIRGHMVDHLQGRLVPSAKYTGITVREDIPGGVGTTYPFAAGDLVGTDPDDEFYTSISCLVRKDTNNGLRPARGRVFQGGLAAGAGTNTGGFQTNVRTDLEDFYEDIRVMNVVGGAVIQMVIKASNPTAANTVAYNTVSGISVAAIPSTQRRRKIGSGS